jgi:hypothetical protein
MALDKDPVIERDLQAYQMILQLWAGENPVKTTKLQVLLAVDALLVSAVQLAGGFTSRNLVVYAVGMVFSLVWTFSIGRTSLFQDVWQIKLRELHDRHPGDPRFDILETKDAIKKAPRTMRYLGGVPSKWYLLFTPLVSAILWLIVLLVTLRS